MPRPDDLMAEIHRARGERVPTLEERYAAHVAECVDLVASAAIRVDVARMVDEAKARNAVIEARLRQDVDDEKAAREAAAAERKAAAAAVPQWTPGGLRLIRSRR